MGKFQRRTDLFEGAPNVDKKCLKSDAPETVIVLLQNFVIQHCLVFLAIHLDCLTAFSILQLVMPCYSMISQTFANIDKHCRLIMLL